MAVQDGKQILRMYTLDLPDDDRLLSYGALDIETDGLDGDDDHLVAIGVGYVDDARKEVEVHTLSGTDGDEAALIEAAFTWLDRHQPAGLVTYNGRDFDLPFLKMKLASLGREPAIGLTGRHVDLFSERKRLANLVDEKWPRLEECLEAYDLPVHETLWNGDVLTNVRFGEELAPEYLRALEEKDVNQVRSLESVIREYASADIEAMIELYEADLNRATRV